MADAWERAAGTARGHELTQAASVKILNELMETTMGEGLKRPSISATFAEYLAGCTDATRKRYKPVIDSLLAHLGEGRCSASVASLTNLELEAWHKAESASGVSASTADYGLKVVSAALARLVRLGLLLNNPGLAVQKTGSTGEARQPFEDAEIAALLAVADAQWRGMIMLAAWCGLRLADAAGLTWGNVDFEKRTLTFRPSKTRRKNCKPLAVAMHADVVAALGELEPGTPAAPLFPRLYGRKPGSHGGLSNEFARLMVKAGVGRERGEEKEGRGRRTCAKSFHSLRHSMISRMANAQVSADVRKAIAGHASDSAHKRYTHLSLGAQRVAIDAMPSLASS